MRLAQMRLFLRVKSSTYLFDRIRVVWSGARELTLNHCRSLGDLGYNPILSRSVYLQLFTQARILHPKLQVL